MAETTWTIEDMAETTWTIEDIERAFDEYLRDCGASEDELREKWHALAVILMCQTVSRTQSPSCEMCESAAVTGQCFGCKDYSHFKAREGQGATG
jgi:hypothetical protein